MRSFIDFQRGCWSCAQELELCSSGVVALSRCSFPRPQLKPSPHPREVSWAFLRPGPTCTTEQGPMRSQQQPLLDHDPWRPSWRPHTGEAICGRPQRSLGRHCGQSPPFWCINCLQRSCQVAMPDAHARRPVLLFCLSFFLFFRTRSHKGVPIGGYKGAQKIHSLDSKPPRLVTDIVSYV